MWMVTGHRCWHQPLFGYALAWQCLLVVVSSASARPLVAVASASARPLAVSLVSLEELTVAALWASARPLVVAAMASARPLVAVSSASARPLAVSLVSLEELTVAALWASTYWS